MAETMTVKPVLPKFDTRSSQYLAFMVEKGLSRYEEEIQKDPSFKLILEKRIQEELRVITNAGFSEYFLIVSDLMRWCRANDIEVGPSRGSAGGSVVSYCLFITDIEPIKFKLYFERFLNDERLEMPDIDVDVCWANRQRAIEYLYSKWGGMEHVTQIITFNTMSEKALLDDFGRVLGLPLNEVKELKATIPEAEGNTYDKLMLEHEPFRNKVHEIAQREPRLIDCMMSMEGLKRHSSIHAGGVIISDTKINDLAPTMQSHKKNGNNRPVVQYEMTEVESVGLLKMDVLGLRTVSLIGFANKMVRSITGDTLFSIKNKPLDCKGAFDVINRGDTHGVFQLDGTGITKFAQQMKIESFNDIVALLALYRPSTLDSGMADEFVKRKNGLSKTEYDHPDLEEELSETYGIMIYQEQVMAVMRKFAGFSMGEADKSRKAMGKKSESIMKGEIDKFTKRSIANGYDPEVVASLADKIKTFARYGFNKAHAVAYAYLTYWTALLKSDYPYAFYPAWLNITDETTKKGWILDLMNRSGIKVKPPHINESFRDFSPLSETEILFGLSAVKGVGDKLISTIIDERENFGKFDGIESFTCRLSVAVDKREALIGSGAFDAVDNRPRKFLYEMCRPINDKLKNKKGKAKTKAIYDNYLEFYDNWDGKEYEPLEKGELEKQYVNFYITDDPIRGVRQELYRLGGVVGVDVTELHGTPIVGGRIAHIHTLMTKKGDEMAFVDIDDGSIQHSVTVFPNTWKRWSKHAKEGEFTAFECSIGDFRGQPTLQAMKVFPIDPNSRENMNVSISVGKPTPIQLAGLYGVLTSADDGDLKIYIKMNDDTHYYTLRTGFLKDIKDKDIAKIEQIFGKDSVSLERIDD